MHQPAYDFRSFFLPSINPFIHPKLILFDLNLFRIRSKTPLNSANSSTSSPKSAAKHTKGDQRQVPSKELRIALTARTSEISSRGSSLSAEVLDLLNKVASEDDFKIIFTRSKEQLDLAPPIMFDNMFIQNTFYHTVHNHQLDILALMLRRQTLDK